MILQPTEGVSLTSLLLKFKWNVDMIGVKDTFNATFTTPEKFIDSTFNLYGPGGRKLYKGRDFTTSESGGVGTGYDTITMLFPSGDLPKATDELTADYVAV